MFTTFIQYLRFNPLQPLFAIENLTSSDTESNQQLISSAESESERITDQSESERTTDQSESERTTDQSEIEDYVDLNHWGDVFLKKILLIEKRNGRIPYKNLEIKINEAFKTFFERFEGYLINQGKNFDSEDFQNLLYSHLELTLKEEIEWDDYSQSVNQILPDIIIALEKIYYKRNSFVSFKELNKVMFDTKKLLENLKGLNKVISYYDPKKDRLLDEKDYNKESYYPLGINEANELILQTRIKLNEFRNYIINYLLRELEILYPLQENVLKKGTNHSPHINEVHPNAKNQPPTILQRIRNFFSKNSTP